MLGGFPLGTHNITSTREKLAKQGLGGGEGSVLLE